MKHIRRFLRDERGEGYIDVAIAVIILFTFTASLLAVFPIFTAQQSLNNTARQLARTVEITGKVGSDVQDTLDGLPGVKPDQVEWDTEWFDESEQKIQLKTPFTVTVTKDVTITILKPALGEPIAIHIPVSASARGISEVYWK